MADLEYRAEKGVGTILLNRPEKRNAFTIEMVDEWARILREIRFDDAVRAVVVTGAGDAFCAGGDLADLTPDKTSAHERRAYLTEHVHQVALALELLLTGDTVDAAEAERLGIVNRVYEDARLLEETVGFAERSPTVRRS